MIERIQRMVKLGCDCVGCGCSKWFWISAPVWVAIGIAIGYWWIGGGSGPDIGSSGS